MNPYTVVTFDMGSTLVHFHPSENALYQAAFRIAGLHPDAAALQKARDEVWRDYFAQVSCSTFEPSPERDLEIEEHMLRATLERLGLDDGARIDRLMAACKAVFRMPGVVRVYAEVPQVLRTLKIHGYRLGIISNWSWDLHDYVHLTGLDRYFDVVIASSRAGCEKPHPAIFQRALEDLGCPPEKALHVGDSYDADVLGARGIGMDALWLDRAGAGGHGDCRAICDLTGVLDVVLGG